MWLEPLISILTGWRKSSLPWNHQKLVFWVNKHNIIAFQFGLLSITEHVQMVCYPYGHIILWSWQLLNDRRLTVKVEGCAVQQRFWGFSIKDRSMFLLFWSKQSDLNHTFDGFNGDWAITVVKASVPVQFIQRLVAPVKCSSYQMWYDLAQFVYGLM